MQSLSEYIEIRAERANLQLGVYSERSRIYEAERSLTHQEYSGESMIEKFAVAVLEARANGWRILSNVVGITSANQQ
jgi:hypothetical protein